MVCCVMSFLIPSTVQQHSACIKVSCTSIRLLLHSVTALGGLKTTVAQNLSLHIEMQEDNRINTVHCHDAVQWLKEDQMQVA